MRFLFVFIVASTSVACFGDRPAPEAGPLVQPMLESSAWSEDRISFVWHWSGDVDAFNAIASRDGIPEPQVELSEHTRTMVVETRGADLIGLSVQACNKGLLKSTCTPWSKVEVGSPD